MNSFKILLRIIGDVFIRAKRSLELRRYDDYTIEDYFRAQGFNIGKNNRILIRDLGPPPYLITIGSHCLIGMHVAFLTHDASGWIFSEDDPSVQKFGPIHVRDNTFIGYGALILPNITIGPNSIVGARAVVTRDVAPNTVAAGNPARVICTVDEYREKIISVWCHQKPPGYLKELKNKAQYSPRYIEEVKMRNRVLLSEHLEKLYGMKGVYHAMGSHIKRGD